MRWTILLTCSPQQSTWYSTSYVGLSLNVPIFRGFSKDAKLKKARIQSTLIDEQIENLKQNIDMEVRAARNTLSMRLEHG